MAKKKTLEELNRLYTQAEEVDKEVFAEMKSNALLVAGEHFTRAGQKFFDRVRTSRELSGEMKVRLTKNHIQKIHKVYTNNLIACAPGVAIEPQLSTEIQDVKAADLNKSVWKDAKHKHKMDERVRNWAEDYFTSGEIAAKIFVNTTGGKFKGYAQASDEQGAPKVDENGEMMPDMEAPEYLPAVGVEDIPAFNLLREPESKTMSDSCYLIIRKMSKVNTLKKMFPDSKDKIKSSEDKTFLIFDNSGEGFRKSDKDEVLLKECFYRPGPEYPQGYYYIYTDEVILDEGELPNGIFPIVTAYCDRIQTTPRGRSPLKQLRPYQIEINRCASKIAEHQMTLGDDKLILPNGSKLSAGGQVPGVRGISVTGQAPIIMEGRSGAQYLEYMNSQIAEMYQVGMVQETTMPSEGQYDPYSMLFRAAAKKRAYQMWIARFGDFLVEFVEVYLDMCRYNLGDEEVIMMVGKKEQVNLAEFRSQGKLGYKLKVEPSNDDIESVMGQQLIMNHILQYVGPQMDKSDIGKIIKNMPYAKLDKSFDDLTADYEAANNEILALDRGEMPKSYPSENHQYLVGKLINRQKQADFRFLHPFIQGNYDAKIAEHNQVIAANAAAIQRSQAGFIPDSGSLVRADYYVNYDAADPSKVRRAEFPASALEWLYTKLQEQGAYKTQISQLGQEEQANLANAGQAQPQQVPPDQGQQ